MGDSHAGTVAWWALVVAAVAGLAFVALLRLDWPLVAFAALVTLQVAFWVAVGAAVIGWLQRRRRPSA